MKKNILIAMITTFCFACNESGKFDEGKLNDAGDKFQKTVKKGADTIGAKLKRLKNKIDTTHIDTLKH
jgi:hypothetical protein